MKISSTLTVITLILTAIILSGCGPSKNDINAFLKQYEVNTTMGSYVLQPPDAITIKCSKVPQIDNSQQTIRPDGKISLEMLGEFDAAGKTPTELADDITVKVKTLYALSGEYPIDVQITKTPSKVYYVFGEVGRPGPIPFTGRVTVLQALAYTQPQVTAWKTEIVVVRPDNQPGVDEKGKKTYNNRKMLKVNLDDIVQKGDASRDVLLEEGDIVWVPPTPLAAVSYVLAEFVRPIGLALQPFSQYYTMQRYQGN